MLISNFYFHAVLQPPRKFTSSNVSTKWNSPKPNLLKMQKFYTHKLYGTFVTRSSSATTPPDWDLEAQRRSEAKEQLLSTIAASNGSLNEDSMALISSLENLNPNPDITRVPHLYTGCFQGISGSFKGTGKPGEAQKLVENTVTLGRATFNAFKPTDIEVQLKQTYNHVGIEAEDAYYLLIQFSVNCPNGGADGPPMEGMFINKAVYSISDLARMDVKFESSTMVPLNPQKDLQSWLKLFRENSTMDENGVVTLALPPAKGFLDYLYLDHDLRITRGNRGAVTVVKRLPETVIHL